MEISTETDITYILKLKEHEFNHLKDLISKINDLTYKYKNEFTDSQVIAVSILNAELNG